MINAYYTWGVPSMEAYVSKRVIGGGSSVLDSCQEKCASALQAHNIALNVFGYVSSFSPVTGMIRCFSASVIICKGLGRQKNLFSVKQYRENSLLQAGIGHLLRGAVEMHPYLHIVNKIIDVVTTFWHLRYYLCLHKVRNANYILRDAVARGDKELYRLCLAAGADVNYTWFGFASLHEAVSAGNREMLQLLIEDGVDVNLSVRSNEKNALDIAIKNGRKDLAQLLLDAGADPNGVRGCRPLYSAVDRRDEESICLLLAAGADINAPCFGLSALFFAVNNGYGEVVRLLLAKGARPDWYGFHQGYSALKCACEKGYEDIARQLIEAGAVISVADLFTGSPLMVAAGAGHIRIVQLLLNAGADISKRDLYGQNALTKAAAAGQGEIVEVLLDAGAEIDYISKYHSSTALHYASHFGREEVVQRLLARGASLDLPSNEGITALAHASRNNHAVVAGILKARIEERTIGDCDLSRASFDSWFSH